MPHLLLVIRSLIVASLRTDHELVLENIALRQQLAVYKTRYPRPRSLTPIAYSESPSANGGRAGAMP
jgi:hypothetical protein